MVHFACVTIVAIAMLARNVAADAGVEAMSTWESLMQNVLSYALVVVPAVFLVRWLKQHPEKMTGSGMLPSALRWCVEGVVDPPEDAEMGEKPEVPEVRCCPFAYRGGRALHPLAVQGSPFARCRRRLSWKSP